MAGCAGGTPAERVVIESDGGVEENDSGDPRDDVVPTLVAPDVPVEPELCERTALSATPAPVEVHIVLDRSGSMAIEEDGRSRFEEAVEAVESVVEGFDRQLRFGLTMYPALGESSERCDPGSVDLPAGVGTGAEITTLIHSSAAVPDPNGYTPTAQTLHQLELSFAANPDPATDRYVFLVTDGLPNCNPVLDPNTCACTLGVQCDEAEACLNAGGAVEVIRELRNMGIDTFVVGFRTDDQASATLDAMARAGRPDATGFLLATDGAELARTLSSLSSNIVSCTYDLDSPVSDPRLVRVEIDGDAVAPENVAVEAEGVTLLGPACDTLRDGVAHEVAIAQECDVEII